MKKMISIFLALVMLLMMLPPVHADAAAAYYWPTPGLKKISQAYKGDSSHAGIDIPGKGYAVYSICEGTVYAKYTGCYNYSGASNTWCMDSGTCSDSNVNKNTSNSSYGYCNYGVGNGFIIKTTDGKYVQYAHMDPNLASLKKGDKVYAGTYLGTTGSSGYSTGAHLHLQVGTSVWNNSININPTNSDITYSNGTGKGKAIEYNTTWNSGGSSEGGTTVPITFDSVWANEIYDTTAHIQADVTWNGSPLTEVGVRWGFSDKMVNTPLTDDVGSVLTKIYYDFGSNGYPSLHSGTIYYYQFYATDGTNEYVSEQNTFRTTGTPQSSTFRFNANGGTGSMSPMSVEVYSAFTLPANTFTRDGYRFVGWNVKGDDGKWYVENQGWTTEDNIHSGNSKKLYEDCAYRWYDESWFRYLPYNFQNYTFYAVWEEIGDVEYTATWYGNYSGKNYFYDSAFTHPLDEYYYFSRDTSVVTVSVDEQTRYACHPSLRVDVLEEGSSGHDLTLRTRTQGSSTKEACVGDNRELILSFKAKSSVPGTTMYYRWGHQSTDEYRSLTLMDEWEEYGIYLNKLPEYGSNLHIYFDTPGSSVWLSELQLVDNTGTNSAFDSFANETGPEGTISYIGGKAYGQLPVPEREGYAFEGWFTQAQGGTQVTANTIAPYADTCLYARWSVSDPAAAVVNGGWCGEDVSWEVTADGTLTLSGTGPMFDYYSNPPWESNLVNTVIIEPGITHIGDAAFQELPVSSVSIPDTVVSIGSAAFAGCTLLTSVELPAALETIGIVAFGACEQLNHVQIPANAELGESVFLGCSSLTDLTIHPDNTRYSVQDGAIYDHREDGRILHELLPAFASDYQIPGDVTAIAPTAMYLTSIQNVVIPASVQEIGAAAFAECYELTEVTFRGDAPVIGENAFAAVEITAYYPDDAFGWTEEILCNYGGTVTWVPYTLITEISSGYSGDTAWVLTSDGVLTISGAGAMKNYTYKSEMPWYSYMDQIDSVMIGDGVTSIGDYAFYGMEITSIRIPESVTTIGNYAFKNATRLDNVVLPAGLTRLGESAFYACSSLSSIEIPASLWTIQPYTFKNCTSLSELILHEGNLQKIADGAFYNTALTSVELPDCLTILDVYVFKNCTQLANVKLSAGLTQIREASLYGTAIRQLSIPEGVTVIRPYAFKNCVNLETVTLPESLTSVDEAAFYACTNLTSVSLPDAVTTIGNYAFRKCTALTSVTFGRDLLTIGESSFYGCTGITTLSLPRGVTTIQDYAFKGCSALEDVRLSTGLTTLGESAFHSCTALCEIIINTKVTSIGNYCFSGSGIRTIEFLGNAPAIGSSAFNRVTATAYYPEGNSTWTSDVMQNYGGTITWKAN